MNKSPLKERIATSVRESSQCVFMRQDFSSLAGYDQVGRALRDLVSDGQLIKIGHGMFARAAKDPISGIVFLLDDRSMVEKCAFKRLNEAVSDVRRVSRKISIPSSAPARPIPGTDRERLSTRLGLEFPYDWSNPSMDENLLIKLVLKRARFNDVLSVCYYFGITRIRAAANSLFGNNYPGRLHSMLKNIESAARDSAA